MPAILERVTTDARTQLRVLVDQGFEPVLLPAGFKREGTRRWRRSTSELDHVVQLFSRHGGSCTVQWGIISHELIWLLFGTEPRGDVGDAALTGTPSAIKHPAQAESFELDGSRHLNTLATDIAEDMENVEEYLRQFQTRKQLREYLMLSRDRKDRRGFTVPAHLPLKLYTAAALAVVDREPAACDLIDQAVNELQAFGDELNKARIARLREAAEGLC